MNNAKILVIGSNSFSGSHFVAEALKCNHHVWGVSRSAEPDACFLPYRWADGDSGRALATASNFQFGIVDLNTDLDKLIDIVVHFSPEVVVNFAAQGMVAESWENPTHWYMTNVVSQVALHDQLRKHSCIKKYIHVTTPEVYGSTDGGWVQEDCHFDPSTPYAVSRAACDLHLQSFFKAYDFPVVFTRAANVYGPGQQLYRVIPRAMLSARTGRSMELHGGGHSRRCFIHIRDAMRATLKLAFEADPGTTWHLSSKDPVSIKELVGKIMERCDASVDKIVKVSEDRLGKDQNYLLDSTAIRESLGWYDEISLDDGLDETLSWIDSNIETLRTLPWSYQHKA